MDTSRWTSLLQRYRRNDTAVGLELIKGLQRSAEDRSTGPLSTATTAPLIYGRARLSERDRRQGGFAFSADVAALDHPSVALSLGRFTRGETRIVRSVDEPSGNAACLPNVPRFCERDGPTGTDDGEKTQRLAFNHGRSPRSSVCFVSCSTAARKREVPLPVTGRWIVFAGTRMENLIMQRFLTACSAVVIVLALAGFGEAQTIDKNGRCHDASGKFAKMEVCKSAAPASCRDKTTKKFAKCGDANTEPVPSKSAPTPVAPK
jgi:hypothetical protein